MTHDHAHHRAPTTQAEHLAALTSPNLVRTSLSHPLRIDEVAAGRCGGRIGISLCPGKRASSLLGPRWERDLAADIDVIRRWRPDAVVTLIEDHEFIELNVIQLGAQVRASGIAWHHLPIVDVHPPDERFETGWQTSGPALVGCLNAGGRVLVHCRGGLGRAGTVAARMLVELDVPAPDAVARVRQARPGAIETADQLNYVLRLQDICNA
ncbi:dual specificity protein phosphatase [Leptothrix cholodnii SP-6]|uniref:Dual specificity protein phosphatase n=1 Tax=Leptothrix cholodnii (strain ATCC 51168 / LMG 8142 / SP-6) TaxID=395495 RepID=B1XWQ7_LEPCP|nr:cyclin-dependent kinase inhibitor 3 family protein [Leptothrix cholodnii]ACB35058.1 dual specificity protein phosphatase [Leptothrix cholodnii SP-6]